MLRYLEDSEALKVSTKELKEQVLSPDESGVGIVHIARQATSEKSKKLFQMFRQGANEVLIAKMARWEEHLSMLVVLERECLALREEVELLFEKQDLFTFLMEGKVNMQKSAPENYQEKIFEELKEVEDQKTREALELLTTEAQVGKWEGERVRARMVRVVKGSRTVVQSPRLFLFWFVLIFPGI